MNPKIRSRYGVDYSKVQPHHVEGITMTVPDQALSIAQILELHSRGLNTTKGLVPIYEPDSDLPDPRKLDLEDRWRLANEYAEELTELKHRMEQVKIAKGEAEKAAKEKERAELIEALKKEAQKTPA